MKHYMELDSRLLDKMETLKLVLETEFRKLQEGESLLWTAAGADRTHDELLEATNDLSDTIIVSVVPPFPGNASVVVSSPQSSQTIQQRLGGPGCERTSGRRIAELP